MTLIDKSDTNLWYSQKNKLQLQNEISNIVLNKDEKGEKADRTYDLLMLLENTLIIRPDLFINSQIKKAWNSLYSNQYEGNLML
jgi:hypothetical protein